MAIAVLFTACNNEEDGDSFQTGTPEDIKGMIEQEGIKFIQEISTLEDQTAINSIDALNSLFETNNPFEEEATPGIIMKPLIPVRFLDEPTTALKLMAPEEEGPETITELYDEVAGTYDWDASLQEWTYTDDVENIIVNFPSDEVGTTNDAQISISYTGFQPTDYTDSLLAEYAGDLPASLVYTLSINQASIMAITITADYKTSGMPTALSTELVIGSYTFLAEVSNDDVNALINYSLKKTGGLTIIDIGASAVGDLTQEAAEEMENEADMINSATVHFQIMDIRLAGDVDVTSLDLALTAISGSDSIARTLEATAINQYVNINAKFVSTNKTIAVAEAVVILGTNTYWDYFLDEEVTENSWETDLHLVFGDESKIALETYFGSGFDALEDEINLFATEMNEDWDAGIDPVSFD